MLCVIWAPGRIFISNRTYGHLAEFSSAIKPIIFVIKKTVLVPGVRPCIRIRSMMHYVYTGEAAVTSKKPEILDLVWDVNYLRVSSHLSRWPVTPATLKGA